MKKLDLYTGNLFMKNVFGLQEIKITGFLADNVLNDRQPPRRVSVQVE
jgi:hypothetical protein